MQPKANIIFGVALACIAGPQVAQAHGTPVSLDEYCVAAHEPKGPGIKLPMPAWRALYSFQRGAWTCNRPASIGLGINPEEEVPLDPRKACEWVAGLSQAHIHEGEAIANQYSVHCGLADGPVARDAGRMTMLKLCNDSSAQRVHAAYASWDTRNSNRPGWTSEGWYGINRGECVDLEVAENFTGDVYIYATAGSDVWSGSDATFCIDAEKSFEISDSDQASCGAAPYERVGMDKFYVTPAGSNRWGFGD